MSELAQASAGLDQDGNPTGKRCSKCGTYKPLDRFCKRYDPTRNGGHQSWCKPCVAEKKRALYRKKKTTKSRFDLAEERRRWAPDGKTLLEKQCAKCMEWHKPGNYRGSKKNTRDGLHSWCRMCDNARKREKRNGSMDHPKWLDYRPDERELERQAGEEYLQKWAATYQRWLQPFQVGMRVYEPNNSTRHKNRGVVKELCPKTGTVEVQRDCDGAGVTWPIRADYLEVEV